MLELTAWILASSISLTQLLGFEPPRRIDVDCDTPRDLKRALALARFVGPVEIHLHGVCTGNFVITSDGVTLRGATPDSGLAAPEGATIALAVLEVADAQAVVRDLIVRGGDVGVLVQGWNAHLQMLEVDVHDQAAGIGVYAMRGAELRLFNFTVRDALVGIALRTEAHINFQNGVVSGHEVGIDAFDDCLVTLNDTTIENNKGAGLNVGDRSDANIFGGAFRENGQVHVNANDWSSVSLLSEVEVGSKTDATPIALSVGRDSTLVSYSAPVIYGDVSALAGASIRMGNTVVNGDLIVSLFSNAHVRTAEITGIVFCSDGSEAICRQTTTGGAFDCPSPTCGSPPAENMRRAPVVPEILEFEMPRPGRRLRSR